MPGLLPNVDPDGLLEYSVVFTDRALNHMSQSFQGVMNDISSTFKKVYNAKAVVVVPGGGTYAMEAVARQFATEKNVLLFETVGLVTAGPRFLIWVISLPNPLY
jgi:Serine-pyruvate aminotransferase/archaeal aspartate aminotransferase